MGSLRYSGFRRSGLSWRFPVGGTWDGGCGVKFRAQPWSREDDLRRFQRGSACIANPRKLEDGFRRISARIPYTLH